MGRKKGQSGRNGRDSNGQRRGVKKFGGEVVIPGNIIVRQLGNKFWPGVNVGQGKDYTLFATGGGRVTFREGRNRQFVDVIPE
ncbi:MAG TPA: bL27 family ribosomal protein [Myxococcota bacterium]|mgnify:CR=1 FL=1|nr:50S ribosomal protein L27 [Myxococcota bacterium]HNZ03235.1 bL27 family ribosomal protein [Myxococcota bacterium]HOD06562.1 bL27 family ribosomal protein [Myxococcota bacterium]HPB50424.1 bL27 family ribosomal protein [Myxococcota bacterium]HQP95322.1 bL27 family ribosomal protein [Myxococcota bacterium]